MLNRLRPLLVACVALVVFAAPVMPAAAAPPKPAALSDQDRADVGRVETYLNQLRTATATFLQLADNGGVARGKFYLSRPGKMRFEYDKPTPIAMLADAAYVFYWDKELQQTSKVELRSTPAWFILRDPISFGPDVIVTRFERSSATLRVTVVEAAQPNAGSLSMVFTENPLTLRQWTVVDQQGKTTTVSLSEQQSGMALDPRLFQYQYLFTGMAH